MEEFAFNFKLLSLILGTAGFMVTLLAIPLRWLMNRQAKMSDDKNALTDTAIQALRNENKAIELRIDAIKEDIARHATHLPSNYVSREDWIRRETVIDAKMDRIYEKVERIKNA